MDKNKISNIGNLMKNDKSRMVVLLSGVVVVATVLVAFSAMSGATKRPAETAAATQLTKTPDMVASPGLGTTSKKHEELIIQENSEKAQKALETGNTAVPVLHDNTGSNEKNPFDLAKKKDVVETQQTPEVVPPVVTPEITPPQPQPQPVVEQPQPQPPQIPQRTQADLKMDEDLAKLMAGTIASWTPAPQRVEIEYGAPQAAAAATSRTSSDSSQQVSAQTATQTTQAPLIKAATILNAVMITALNSDEPGPIMAQVVSGPFSGARIMGTYSVGNMAEKATLQFNTMSWKGAVSAVQIQAYAVDPESARTALATSVDKHYLERFGTMFASSFLQGYADALTQSGATTTSSVGSGGASSQTTYPVLGAKDKVTVALGKVGEGWGKMMEPSINRKATIHIEQGTPLGVLFMSDVKMPVLAQQ